MARKKATDEQIIKALLTSGTAQDAASACGISVRTLYDRTREPAFIALYSKARTDLLRGTLAELRQHTSQATQTIVQIMNDTEQKASTRLQAAQMILDNAYKYTKQLQAAEDTANREQDKQDNAGWDLFPKPF